VTVTLAADHRVSDGHSGSRFLTELRSPASGARVPLNEADARQLIRATLREVAPEVDLDEVRPRETLQEALNLGSIDFLNFATGLHAKTDLEIPERDYPLLSTLKGCIEYLKARG
jgi:acyl carrier protein